MQRGAMAPKGRKEWTSAKAESLEKARVWFGQRMRERREALNVTQADLARAVGVSRKTVNGIEYGHTSPSFPLYIAIVRALKAGKIPFVS